MHHVRPWGRRHFRSISFLPSILIFFFFQDSERVYVSFHQSSIFCFVVWRWVDTVVSGPCGLTHVTFLSCQNYLETTNYEVLENLEGVSLAFAPFHGKDPDPRRQHCTLYEHRAVVTFSLCAGCFKVTGFFLETGHGVSRGQPSLSKHFVYH